MSVQAESVLSQDVVTQAVSRAAEEIRREFIRRITEVQSFPLMTFGVPVPSELLAEQETHKNLVESYSGGYVDLRVRGTKVQRPGIVLYKEKSEDIFAAPDQDMWVYMTPEGLFRSSVALCAPESGAGECNLCPMLGTEETDPLLWINFGEQALTELESLI